MPLFGKVLAGVNVVAAIGFIVLGVMDYDRRNAWAFSILQEEFIVKGIALDEEEMDADGRSVAALGAGRDMQKALFGGAGQSFRTQAAAAKNRHDSLADQIKNADDKVVKVKEIGQALARNAVEHYEIATASPNNFDALYNKVMGPEGPFEAASKEATKSAKESAPDVRRRAIARFLLGTSLAEGDFKQTMAVVGEEAYAQAVDAQATHLRSMIPLVENDIVKDRAHFATQHRALIDQIVELDGQLHNLQEHLAHHEEDLKTYQGQLGDRRRDAEDLNKRIKQAQAATAAALARQSDLEKQLFDADHEAAKTEADNQKLEREIKTKELGR
jgi:hypothetical protein